VSAIVVDSVLELVAGGRAGPLRENGPFEVQPKTATAESEQSRRTFGMLFTPSSWKGCLPRRT